MWDDEVNKKIKDAADQYHPAYDETAWHKMELLLQEHLPVEKKRKRKYFLILLASLLAGGLLFVVYNKQGNPVSKNSQKTANKNTIAANQLSQQKPLSNGEDVSFSPATVQPSNAIKQAIPLNRERLHQQGKNVAGKSGEEKPGNAFVNATERTSVNKQGKTNTIITPGTIEKAGDAENPPIENTTTFSQQTIEKKNNISEKERTVVPTPQASQEIIKTIKDTANTKEVAKNGNLKNSDPKKKSTRADKSFGNNFAIDFSAGPDVSSVDFDEAGKIAISYGAGLSYALTARFTLRSGFYVSEKIYSADKNEYQIPAGASNVDYLYNINANCKVYEIPLTVSYNFSKNKNHQWFASAGLSSYLMKKESYDYNYKYPGGNMDTKSWSISNQNQNYFSVIDLSAGYEYSFSKRTSLLAEPYLKIPLSGIGAGKVKLNSGGILFTFIVKPFYKK